jgi:hypothetical protein
MCKNCFDSIKGDCLAFGNPALMSDDDDIYSNGDFDIDIVDYDEDEYDDR